MHKFTDDYDPKYDPNIKPEPQYKPVHPALKAFLIMLAISFTYLFIQALRHLPN